MTHASLKRAFPIVLILSACHFALSEYLSNHYLTLPFTRADRGLPVTASEEFLSRIAFILQIPFLMLNFLSGGLIALVPTSFQWAVIGFHSVLWGVVLYSVGLYLWRSCNVAWARLSIRWSERGANAPRRSS